MTREEQYVFVDELTRRLRNELLSSVQRVPEAWDGLELRQWIRDYVSDNTTFHDLPSWTRKRARDYKNEVLVSNLTRV